MTSPETGPEDGAGAAGPLRLPSTTKRSQPEPPKIRAATPIAGPSGWQENVAPEVDESGVGGCPNTRGLFLLSQATGAMFPLRCTRLSCSYCCLLNARRRSLAIAFARPERAVLLTDVGEDWETIRARAKRVRYLIAEATGKPFEWVWHIEPNPSGDGRHHMHAWTHGAFVPQRTLSAIADRAGMGAFARINKIRSNVGASHYGLKGLGYGLKNATDLDPLRQAGYLLSNGRRLTHQSRGYFRSEDGARIGARAAEELGLGASRTRDPGPWQVISG